MTPATRDFGRAGFTLVEVLVVLAVLGLLVSLTTTVLHAVSNGSRAVSRADAEAERRSATVGLLRRLLAQARPDTTASEAAGAGAFRGMRQRIEFLAPLSRRFGAEDIVAYVLRADERGILHVAWRLDRPADEPATAADDILPGTSDAAFSYLGPVEPGRPASWSDGWEDREHLPCAIRLRFALDAKPVEIVVAPRIGRGGPPA